MVHRDDKVLNPFQKGLEVQMRRLIVLLFMIAGCGGAEVAHPTTCNVVHAAQAACAQLPAAEAWACQPVDGGTREAPQ